MRPPKYTCNFFDPIQTVNLIDGPKKCFGYTNMMCHAGNHTFHYSRLSHVTTESLRHLRQTNSFQKKVTNRNLPQRYQRRVVYRCEIAVMPPPWEDWKLDEDFFRAMICWNLTHPDRKLDRVLDNICLAIDSSKALFDVIPDNPFPARGLVLALAHLVKLGTVRISNDFDCGFAYTELFVDYIKGQGGGPNVRKGYCALG